MFGYEESWESAKRHCLSNMKFLEQLINFDVFSKVISIYLGIQILEIPYKIPKDEGIRQRVSGQVVGGVHIDFWLA